MKTKYRVTFNGKTISAHRTLENARRRATREAASAQKCGADCPPYIVRDDDMSYGARIFQACSDGDHISLGKET